MRGNIHGKLRATGLTHTRSNPPTGDASFKISDGKIDIKTSNYTILHGRDYGERNPPFDDTPVEHKSGWESTFPWILGGLASVVAVPTTGLSAAAVNGGLLGGLAALSSVKVRKKGKNILRDSYHSKLLRGVIAGAEKIPKRNMIEKELDLTQIYGTIGRLSLPPRLDRNVIQLNEILHFGKNSNTNSFSYDIETLGKRKEPLADLANRYHAVIEPVMTADDGSDEYYAIVTWDGKTVTFKSTDPTFPMTAAEFIAAFEDAKWNKVLNNLANNTSLSLSSTKKSSMIEIAKMLLDSGYELAFVSGVLANIMHEGEIGKFESSNYTGNPSAKPNYLKKMDENYNYREKYSGKNITDINLSDLEKLLIELEYYNWNEGKFGLGSIQWTGSRTKTLFEIYKEHAGKHDEITLEQALEAEMKMISRELTGAYSYIYSAWLNENQNSLDSNQAAYNAGVDICKKYERPKVDSSVQRGNTAIEIYCILVK